MNFVFFSGMPYCGGCVSWRHDVKIFLWHGRLCWVCSLEPQISLSRSQFCFVATFCTIYGCGLAMTCLAVTMYPDRYLMFQVFSWFRA